VAGFDDAHRQASLFPARARRSSTRAQRCVAAHLETRRFLAGFSKDTHVRDAEQGRIRLAGHRWPYAPLVALLTAATAWPAAGYGALTITEAGRLVEAGRCGSSAGRSSRSCWSRRCWRSSPSGRLGDRPGPITPAIGALEPRPRQRISRSGGPGRAPLRAPRGGAPSVWVALIGLTLCIPVIVGTALIEYWAAPAGLASFWVIVRGGVHASLLYGAARVRPRELLVRPACRALRRLATEQGSTVDDGFVVPVTWRIAGMAMPTVVAIMVAIESGAWTSPRGTELLALSVVVVVALSWLHYENGRSAVREIGESVPRPRRRRREPARHGSIEGPLLEMARAFNAAARRVGADRAAARARYLALFERAGDAIVLVEPGTRRVMAANAQAERLFGAGSSTWSATYLDLFDEETGRGTRRWRAPRRGGRGLHHGRPRVRRDGSNCPWTSPSARSPIGEQWLFQASCAT
jgi:PAS domain-containing protein